ncbi:MAG: rane fusion protein YbhG [Clostridiales bacterium]|nr:rane fusion protein YbhG [Clostridiales bacterium]
MRKISIFIFAIIIVILLSSCTGKANESKVFTGIVEAEQYNIYNEISGKVKELKIQEGQNIAKNSLVAVLDKEALKIQKKEAEKLVAVNQAKLDELLAGSRSQEIEQVQANIDQLYANVRAQEKVLNILNKKLEDLQALYEVGGATLQQIEELKMSIATTEGTIDALKANISGAAAKRNLLEEGPAIKSINTMQAAVEQAKVSLELADLQLSKAEIYSPHGGRVVYTFVKTGEMVSAASPIATVMDMNDVWVKIYIPEKYISMVKVGQELDVTSDAFPDKVFKGKITFVASEAEFTPRNVETKEEKAKTLMEVKIDLDNAKQQLRPGMMVDVFINEIPNSL